MSLYSYNYLKKGMIMLPVSGEVERLRAENASLREALQQTGVIANKQMGYQRELERKIAKLSERIRDVEKINKDKMLTVAREIRYLNQVILVLAEGLRLPLPALLTVPEISGNSRTVLTLMQMMDRRRLLWVDETEGHSGEMCPAITGSVAVFDNMSPGPTDLYACVHVQNRGGKFQTLVSNIEDSVSFIETSNIKNDAFYKKVLTHILAGYEGFAYDPRFPERAVANSSYNTDVAWFRYRSIQVITKMVIPVPVQGFIQRKLVWKDVNDELFEALPLHQRAHVWWILGLEITRQSREKRASIDVEQKTAV